MHLENDDLIGEQTLTGAQLQEQINAFRAKYPRIALFNDIAAFEAWQQTPDEDEDFAAIHVALLLSKEHRIVPREL